MDQIELRKEYDEAREKYRSSVEEVRMADQTMRDRGNAQVRFCIWQILLFFPLFGLYVWYVGRQLGIVDFSVIFFIFYLISYLVNHWTTYKSRQEIAKKLVVSNAHEKRFEKLGEKLRHVEQKGDL
ncbi:MAG: hypothetical protein JJ957_19165 [Pseudomonadales bacterium]|nr:hypothetical protein [Pseudomonadales bacterium]MBO6597615.1 hypothetical protein [Pseudomonadales bacterium]MBO6824335.1 hypothetical protein [Pseudomonadales bacterium]